MVFVLLFVESSKDQSTWGAFSGRVWTVSFVLVLVLKVSCSAMSC